MNDFLAILRRKKITSLPKKWGIIFNFQSKIANDIKQWVIIGFMAN